jgi:hypothetical protein
VNLVADRASATSALGSGVAKIAAPLFAEAISALAAALLPEWSTARRAADRRFAARLGRQPSASVQELAERA